MYKEEFLEELEALLGGNDSYVLKFKTNGTLVIHTNLIETEDGRLINKDEVLDDDEEEEEQISDTDDLDIY